jgi:hypothetical protein
MDLDDKTRIANMLNCQLGELPIKYLGVPINDTKLGRVTFADLTEKMARSILTNTCLSSLPTYCMGFYLLPLGTHQRMDCIRSGFFWRGARGDFKYHMVRWSIVCRPKEFGGLGILNTQIFNECLIVKWIWKIYQHKESLWVRLLDAKYMRGRGISSDLMR